MSFKFCKVCNNMITYSSTDNKTLKEFCAKCNVEEVVVNEGKAILLSRKKFSNDDMLFNQVKKNPYYRYDNTLGRIKDPVHSGTNDPLIPIKYNQQNMKFCMKNERTGEVFKMDKKQ